MKETLRRRFCATAIGSVPHTDASMICEKILSGYRDIPFWPQMPKRTFSENMYVQFAENFPGIVIDEERKRIWVDTSKDLSGKLEKAYQKIVDEDYSYFSVTERAAAGLYEFIRQAKKTDLRKRSFLKGQITGPVSFGLSVTDEKKQAILYNNELSSALVKILAIKARLQIRELKKVFEKIIIFIDEPYLVSIGSSVVNIRKDDAVAKINEIINAIHEERALAGIHCCGNTDWSILLGLDLDILNFDAYSYSKSISLYIDALKLFLDKGNILAWGIIPTSEKIKSETPESMMERLEEGFGYLFEKGIEKEAILDSLMLTPSCGCGMMNEKEAERVLELNLKVSQRLREWMRE